MDEDIAIAVGRTVQRYRLRHDPPMTQSALAQAAGLASDQRISNIERGVTQATIPELEAIRKILGVPLRLLVGDETDPTDRVKRLCELEEQAHQVAINADDEAWTEFIRDMQHALRRARTLQDQRQEHREGKKRRKER